MAMGINQAREQYYFAKIQNLTVKFR